MVTNVNPITGIRFGVVDLRTLAGWVFDAFYEKGRNLTAEAALAEFKAENPNATAGDVQEFLDLDGGNPEEDTYELEADGMKLRLTHLGDEALVWVYESPVTARVRLCSPSVPNAGDLNSPLNEGEEGYECYSLPDEWWAGEAGRLILLDDA